MLNFMQKIRFKVHVAECTKLDRNWNTQCFNPVFRYIHFSRLYMPCSGEGRIVCGGKTFILKKGAMFLVPPYAHISVNCPRFLVKYWCHFNAPVEGFSNDIFSMLPNVTEIKMTEEQFSWNKMLFERILAMSRADGERILNPLDELCATSALALLVEPFLKQIPQKIIPQNNVDRIMKIVQYMNENLASGITLKTLAQVAGLHPNYLSVLFLRCTGISPIAYLLRLRMSYALTELRRGNMRIGEIAERIGFDNISYFSQFFRTRMGVSPREWQKKCEQEKDSMPSGK